jgi:NAD(P)-dependent dehydrogenase (short-subunit alcohol dehydrogenase family)
MVARGRGVVLNVNSLQGSRAFPGYTAYGATKAALMRLTDGLADEVAGTGVLVADVSPGLVATDMTTSPGLGDLLADVPADEWTPIDKVVGVVRALVSRQHDEVHGRFVHAEDDVPGLARLLAGADDDARRLRMVPLPADPLFDGA